MQRLDLRVFALKIRNFGYLLNIILKVNERVITDLDSNIINFFLGLDIDFAIYKVFAIRDLI